MTDLNLTPGISYRDYVQDGYIIPGGSGSSARLTLAAGTSITLENIKTNRLRELAVIRCVPSATNAISARIKLDNPGITHAGYSTFDIGSIGLFNISTDIPKIKKDYPDSTFTQGINIRVTRADTTVVDFFHSFTETVDYKNKNKRYSLNNILIPTLVGGQQIVDALSVEITIGLSVDSTAPGAPTPILTNYDQITIGRLWIGNYMPVCFDAPWSITLDNPSKINYSAGLDAHAVEQRRRRRGSFPIESIVQNDAMTSITDIDSGFPFASFSDMQLQCGKDYPLVVSHRRERNESHPDRIYPDPYVLFGLMSKDMQIQHVDGPLYQTQIDVVELI